MCVVKLSINFGTIFLWQHLVKYNNGWVIAQLALSFLSQSTGCDVISATTTVVSLYSTVLRCSIPFLVNFICQSPLSKNLINIDRILSWADQGVVFKIGACFVALIFLTKSIGIKLALPQAAWLSIFLEENQKCCTSVRDLI